MFVDSNAIDFFNTQMVLTKVNAEVDSALAKHYHVSGYPTIVLTDQTGKEIDRIVGYLATEPFLKTLTDYKNGIGTLDDLLNQAKTKEDRALYFEIADKYKYRGGSVEAESWYTKVISAGEPKDTLTAKSRLAIADMYRRSKDYDKSISLFSAIAADFKQGPAAEEADIMTAVAYRQKGDTTMAISSFEKFMKNHPNSEDTAYAQKQIAKLKAKPTEEKK